MIQKQEFGRTGHHSTQLIFGAYALSKATPKEADEVLEGILAYGINHIDMARLYGNAEERVGEWLKKQHGRFFLATKTRSRSYDGAWKDLRTSLDFLGVDRVDLWQMHGLTNPLAWEKVMASGGALQAFLEARDQGLVRFLGVTGHGSKVAAVHLRSLERYAFDSVLLPYNYWMMQNPTYAANFEALFQYCRSHNTALQTIKSIARRPWDNRPKTFNTYFYEPFETQAAVDRAIHWAMALTGSFLITAGDMRLVGKILDAAARFERRPSEAEMLALTEEYGVRQIFSGL